MMEGEGCLVGEASRERLSRRVAGGAGGGVEGLAHCGDNGYRVGWRGESYRVWRGVRRRLGTGQ